MHPRRSLPLLLGLLLASSAAFAEPPQMSITGPATVTPGSAVFLQLETDAVAVEWIVFPQSAVGNFIPLTLYQGMTPDGKPILKYAAFFSSPTAGTYTFAAVGVKDNQLGKAVHTLINGKPDPDPGPDPEPDPEPDPDPDPDPIPPPPGERFILVVAETGTRTAQQFQAISGLTSFLKTTKATFRNADPDLKDYSTGKTPEWLTSYLAKIQEAKVALPVLLIAAPGDAGNTVLAIVPLPKTAAECIAVVKKNGG